MIRTKMLAGDLYDASAAFLAAPYFRFGALLAAALGVIAPAATGHAVDWAKSRLVEVVTVEYRFIPNRLVFRRDVAYRLQVINHGLELHELTAPEFFRAIEIRNPKALNEERTELVLQPGEHKELYFAAHRPGHYDLRCADHDWAGMTGGITVK